MMEPDVQLSAALEAARARRTRLRTELNDLEGAISGPATGRIKEWTVEVMEQLGKLREAFEEHVIVTEKPDGLYEEILHRAPRLSGQVHRLQEEHPVIIGEIDEVDGRLESMDVGASWPLDQARDDLQRLLGKIVRHRQRGADLVWEAYNVDIGGME